MCVCVCACVCPTSFLNASFDLRGNPEPFLLHDFWGACSCVGQAFEGETMLADIEHYCCCALTLWMQWFSVPARALAWFREDVWVCICLSVYIILYVSEVTPKDKLSILGVAQI